MKKDSGFTLLEIAIALSIFGILMLSFSQLLRSEIRFLNTASEKNEVEVKARNAMMRVLDEIRIHNYTTYSPDSEGYDGGVYRIEPDTTDTTKRVIINANPNPGVLTTLQKDPTQVSAGIYYDAEQKNLWFSDGAKINLIADSIYGFAISPVSSDSQHLVRIFIGAGDSEGEYYDLITWARLY